ncbi:MAG: hypothetical protein ACRD3E_07640 [Terriglobales bacterium]
MQTMDPPVHSLGHIFQALHGRESPHRWRYVERPEIHISKHPAVGEKAK